MDFRSNIKNRLYREINFLHKRKITQMMLIQSAYNKFRNSVNKDITLSKKEYPKTINSCDINSCVINFCDINFCEFGPHSQKISRKNVSNLDDRKNECRKNLSFFTFYFCPKYMNITL